MTITVKEHNGYYLAVDEKTGEWKSVDGVFWCSPQFGLDPAYSLTQRLRVAVFTYLDTLAEASDPSKAEQAEPQRAEVGDHISVGGKKYLVLDVTRNHVWAESSNTTFFEHGVYAIVDSPEPELTTGDKITERDGVWEHDDKSTRILTHGGKVSIYIGSGSGYGGEWFDDRMICSSESYRFVSTDPADLIPEAWRK